MSLAALIDSLPLPIVQAPMAGASSPEMALAVSLAGGLGSIAAAAFAPDAIEASAAMVRAATPAPFAINLLVAPKSQPSAAELDAALARLKPWYDELGAPLTGTDANRVVIAARESAQDTVNQAGQEITKRNLSIQPTLTR